MCTLLFEIQTQRSARQRITAAIVYGEAYIEHGGARVIATAWQKYTEILKEKSF